MSKVMDVLDVKGLGCAAVTVYMPVIDRERLRVLGRREGRAISYLIRRAIREYLSRCRTTEKGKVLRWSKKEN